MELTLQNLKDAFLYVAGRIEEQKEYLSQLDRELGDGDHGVTMSLGWQAIVETIDMYEGVDCGDMMKQIAMSFLNAVGSSVGPLYATAFMRGGTVLQGKSILTKEDIIQFWIQVVNGIQERGKAVVGDKTMIDTWIPAVESLKKAYDEGKSLLQCLKEAVRAGEVGMKSTIHLLSRRGRSSKLGERVIGHQDPGATSAYTILLSFYEALQRVNAQ